MMQLLPNIKTAAFAALLSATTVANAAEVSVSPEPGSTQIGLNTFTLTFEGASNVSTNYNADTAPYLCFGDEVKSTLSKWGDTVKDNSVELYFSYEVKEPGLWSMVIPAGYLTVDGEVCETMQFDYNVKTLSYSVTPDGDVYAASQITFTFNGFDSVEVTDPAGIVLSDYLTKPELTLTTEGNVLTLSFEEITTPGFWYVNISENSLRLDGIELTQSIRAYLSIVKEPEYQTVITPADGDTVSQLSVITVDFVGATSLEMGYDDEYSWPYLRDSSYTQVGDHITDRLFEGTRMVLTLDTPVTEPGKYTLVIPYDGLMVNGEYPNGNLYATYTVDPSVSAGALEAENAGTAVYDLLGRRVADSLDNLPCGIYITGRRKVAVTR